MSGLKLLNVDPVGGTAAAIGGKLPVAVDTATETGILAFTRKAEDVIDHEITLKRVNDLADATSGFQTALDRKRIELSTDPDIAGREAKMQQFAQAEFSARHGSMDSETAALFKRSANPLADAMSSSVRHAAQKDQIDQSLGTLNDTNEKLITASAEAKNPNERAALLGQIDTNLRTARDGQVLSEAQYQAAKKATLGKADQAAALSLMRDNPGGTATLLAKADFLPNLDPVARQNLIDRAGAEVLRRTNLAYTQAARADLAERRTTAQLGNNIMKEIIDASVTPEGISDELLARAKNVVPWHDYQAAKKLKVGGTEIDSKGALDAIVPDLDTRDVSKELSDLLNTNKITGPTYTKMMERNQGLLKDDKPQSPYRQGRDYIKTILDPAAAGVGGNLLGGITAGLRADALMEYDTWADANRDKVKADPRLANDYALDVGRRYKLVEFSSTTQALGLPVFFKGARETFDEGAAEKAARDTQAAYDKGEMSKPEYLNQARLLRQWGTALSAKNAATVNVPSGGGQGGNK